MIPWGRQEKMLSIDKSYIYGSYVEIEKNASSSVNSWRLIHGG